MRGIPSSSRVMDPIFILRDRESKYLHGTKSREPLSQSLEFRSDEKVREAAVQRMDQNILAITSRDIVSAKAHYHKSCYRNYTRDEKPLL